jgi:hypothetical protein
MLRKRNDSVKDGCGDSGTDGQNYTKDHAFNDVNFGYPGADKRERSRPGKYTTNDADLTRTDGFEHGSGSRSIYQDVEQNQRPNGEFDSTGPIKAGVNRGQK